MKKILLVVTLAAIAGIIWYLESVTVHTGTQNGNGVPRAINFNSSSTIAESSSTVTESLSMIVAADKKAGYNPAIEIVGPTGFVNVSSTFKLADLIGKKVILVDFWTYSCINCIRTIPYLNAWYQKYKDQGFTIVGIHSPEFNFEKDINNVKAAVQKYGIRYPVVLDNNHDTWQAYGNLYWPHEYLIDIAGYIVHDHIGEGDYDATEAEIQKLLAERATVYGANTASIATSTVAVQQANLSGIFSPETYFGAAQNEYLANGSPSTVGAQVLREPPNVVLNSLYLVGSWNFKNEYAADNESGAKIIYRYHSSKVFFVASSPSPVTVEVLQDGKPVSAAAGGDVKNGRVVISQSRLYNLINNPDGSGEHTIELIIDSPGLEAFTFTFG